MSYYEVHCGQCKWWGVIENTKIIKGVSVCPDCLSADYLEYEQEEA